jgi:5-methyltetrahydropteroyltriglutamate--homocysteine methyltransferase
MTSENRFLTTHVGSLPRPDDLIEIMFAREDGIPIDRAALAERIELAVDEAVARQVEAGVDVVNDGEWPKPSYATYIKDRLSGFGGTGNAFAFQDIEEYPRTKARVFADPGRKHRKTPACNCPISVKDMEAPIEDARRLQVAAKKYAAAGLFMSAASPGVTGYFFRNDFYPTHESYLFALADALRHEYEAIVNAGIMLQIDCPDLAMGRHSQYADLSLAQFRDRMELHIEVLNRALVNIPAEKVRMHLCWGNYPGPQSNYIEHPELVAQRIGRYANLVGRDNVMAGTDCGFSIHVGSGGVDADVVWAKLAALAQGAQIASRKFWPGR